MAARTPSAPESSIRDIRQFVRPDFDRILTRSAVVGHSEECLVSLTQDQYLVLDMISDNPRCLIEGAAGTGKTVLALEYARRQALNGKRVLLLCFNRLLGDWFEHCARNLEIPTLQATSYFRYLRRLVTSSELRQEFEVGAAKVDQATLFAEVLPFYALLVAEGSQPQIDVLVIDEAQDLLHSGTLDIISALLKGGVAGGHWYVFGDFTRQCIYGRPSSAGLDALSAGCPHLTRTKLLTNCRNTRRIGEETALLSGFSSPPYKLGQVDGLAVDYRYWKDRNHELKRLTEIVEELLSEEMHPRDIILLSPRKFAESVASGLTCRTQKGGTLAAFEIRDGVPGESTRCVIGFATVQSFKGMESPAIILCDVDQVDNEAAQSLLYIGMSRARSLLVMMVHDSVHEAIARSLVQKFTEIWKS